MKTIVLFCIVISIGVIECSKQQHPKNHAQHNRIKEIATGASNSLRKLMETTHTASKQRKHKPDAAIFYKLRASLSQANKKLDGAYRNWQKSFLKNRKKSEFTQTLGKLTRALLEKALAPKLESDVSIFSLFREDSLQSEEAQKFIEAIRELLAAMNECVEAGASPVEILKSLIKESSKGHNDRRKVGTFDFIEDNYGIVISTLNVEKEECSRRCDSIEELIDVLSRHNNPTASDDGDIAEDLDDYI